MSRLVVQKKSSSTNLSPSSKDNHPSLFYKPPASYLNSFQNFRKTDKALTPSKASNPNSPFKPKLQGSQQSPRKLNKSIDASTPIYVINNKKNYIIYNDIKCNNSFMTQGGQLLCPFDDDQKKDLNNKKTLNDHYQQIFQQIQLNSSPQNHQPPHLETPSFASSSLQKISLRNQDLLHKKNSKIDLPKQLPETQQQVFQKGNYGTEKISKPNRNEENQEPFERKEKVKRGKKIDITTDVGYSTEAESQVGGQLIAKERKTTCKQVAQPSKKRWDKNEDQILLESYESFCKSSKKINKWEFISQKIGDRNPSQCKQRFKRLVKPEGVRKKWSEEEDKILRTAVEVEKVGSWELIAEKFKTKGFSRTGKQVRERYKNHLDPAINLEPFKLEEDLLILNLYKVYMNKWSKIAKHLVNRSENQVKNRFHYHLKKNLGQGFNDKKVENNPAKIDTDTLSEEELPEIDEEKYMEIMGILREKSGKSTALKKGLSAESQKAYENLVNVENPFDEK